MLLCLQIGYWNEKRGYVNTAVYRPTLEEFYGLQNRTYIVTTILVGPGRPGHSPLYGSVAETTSMCVYRKLPT